jgi:tetratricopeptide (TPR) repeat protein
VLGLPVPEDMPGRPLPAVAGGADAGAMASRQLASYEQLPRERPEELTRVAAEQDEERLRELVALGYISADTLERDRRSGRAADGTAGGAVTREERQASADLEGEVTEAYNLGRMFITQGEFEAAREQLQLALERRPGFGLAWSSLAQVESIRGDHSRAFELLAEGFDRSLTMPRFAVTSLVDEATKAGRLADAGPVLERMAPVYRRDSAYFSALGLLHEETGRPDSALRHYRQALKMDPLDELATQQTLSLLRRLGRPEEAAALTEESVVAVSGNVIAMNQLAVILLGQGFPQHAERLLRRVLESDPGNPGVLANLAAVQLRQGRRDEAIATMASAVARDPTDARNQFNLGAMLAEQGRFADALAAFTAARDHGLKTPPVYVAMAKMSFRLGDRAAAERALQEALEIDPGQQEARAMLDALRRG